MITETEDDWQDPDPEYVDEDEPCPHGIVPKKDCDWCKEERDE
ncbi:hypothetical protein [Pandoraea sp.]|nr:hypothetical protein [Pandoraea sp.]